MQYERSCFAVTSFLLARSLKAFFGPDILVDRGLPSPLEARGGEQAAGFSALFCPSSPAFHKNRRQHSYLPTNRRVSLRGHRKTTTSLGNPGRRDTTARPPGGSGIHHVTPTANTRQLRIARENQHQ